MISLKSKVVINMEKKKTFIIIAVALLVLSIGITFAYFIAKIGPGSSANVNVTTGTVDDLKFNVSKTYH